MSKKRTTSSKATVGRKVTGRQDLTQSRQEAEPPQEITTPPPPKKGKAWQDLTQSHQEVEPPQEITTPFSSKKGKAWQDPTQSHPEASSRVEIPRTSISCRLPQIKDPFYLIELQFDDDEEVSPF